MKSPLILLYLFIFASPAQAMFGLLGRDQCGHQQSAFPSVQSDNRHAINVQLQGLVSQRQQMQGRMSQLNANILRMQGSIRGYIQSPWAETMLAHMDNGFDCCAPTGVYALLQLPDSGRRPAGQDLPPPEYGEITPVDPTPEPPPYNPPTYTPPAPPANSCQGYSVNYCSSNWGTPYTPPKHGGGLCLQTGFAATPAWYQAACRNGGKIDAQVCSHPNIAKNTSYYQDCMNTLNNYQAASVQKRQLGAHIQEINVSIARFKGTGSGSGNGSEVKSGIGGLLGNVIKTLGPFMLSQYMSYQQEKSVAQTQYGPGSFAAKYGPPRPVTNVDGSIGSPIAPPRPYYNYPQPPPPNYGPRYGYPFSYGGNYGAVLPNFQQGGFGCTPGASNNGMSLISTLLGGGLGLNLNAKLQSNFGPNGGYAPYQAYLNGYGNQHAGVPPYAFNGHTPPYQPGSIYGTTPTYRPPYASPNGYQAVPNYFSRFNVNFNPTANTQQQFPPYSYAPPIYNQTQPQANNYGWQYNSYFYAQDQNNQQMLLENEARMRQRAMNVNWQTNSITTLNAGNTAQYYPSSYTSMSYNTQNPYTYSANPSAYNQVDMKALMQNLLMGNSMYFKVNATAN